MDGICQRYHSRPSEVVGIEDPLSALDFDAAIAVRASKMEKDEMEDKKDPKAKRASGVAAVKALQEQVAASGRK